MNIGRTLITFGLVLIGAGVLFLLSDKLPVKLGKLPGDIAIKGKNGGGFYFPIVTCIVLSALLTLIGWLFSRRG
ncbi:MAG: DUF2905 domain-containing protein [Bryobacteraceae bacterium]